MARFGVFSERKHCKRWRWYGYGLLAERRRGPIKNKNKLYKFSGLTLSDVRDAKHGDSAKGWVRQMKRQ